MSLVMTAAPAAEPVTLAEAKAQLRVDGTAEDAFIDSLIVTSRLQVEAALGLALITQSWRWTLDAWPEDGVLVPPLRPVQAIAAIEIHNADGTTTTLAPALYHLDGKAQPPRIVATGTSLPQPGMPAEGISIDLSAGFGDLAADVPMPIRHAALMLVAHWYENRDPIGTSGEAPRIPRAVSELLAPYRLVRL